MTRPVARRTAPSSGPRSGRGSRRRGRPTGRRPCRTSRPPLASSRSPRTRPPRVGINHSWDGPGFQQPVLAGGHLDDDLALVSGLVGQHRLAATSPIAKMCGRGPHLPADPDEAAAIDGDAGLLGADQLAVGLRPTATRIRSKVSVAGAFGPSKYTGQVRRSAPGRPSPSS